MKGRYYVMIVAAALSCAACTSGNVESGQSPVKVKTWIVSTSENGTARTFSGTVEEENGTAVSFPTGGTIRSIDVIVGQRVGAGQVLATVDPTSVQSSYEAAKATLEQAQDAYARMKQLYDKGSLPEIQWVEVQSKLQQAESMEQIARKNLDDCAIRAPFGGVISAKEMEVGQQAAPGMPVVRVVKIDRVKVKIAVPEAEIADLKVGRKAEIRVAALGDKAFEGHVVEKGVAADPLSHAYEVKLLVMNPTFELMPGMVTKTALAPEESLAAIVLPGRAVQLDERNRTFVWLVDDGRAVRRFVECGAPTAHGVTILSGLNPGDEVLVEGQQKVSENTVVEIIR
ncbi:MAG: efflux RND transporter periplasmic adaptor subunit [Alistipes sp.]|uniref:efflux RND transporter periplasmic adaptor subunit n=1 Tax=Alistipes sp. TaxID=1872444 RepID=UPI0023F03565|nr:efflux RND transporter periplasmic adaptor subunit [Alistipes sp.]MBQ7893306.1 efflux RND transporter periplasmic adaptor subunit [Alistipes sp.]